MAPDLTRGVVTVLSIEGERQRFMISEKREVLTLKEVTEVLVGHKHCQKYAR